MSHETIHHKDQPDLFPDTLPSEVERERAASHKPTNPKDTLGIDKLPVHLWPNTATAMGAMGLTAGAFKYGRANWRATGVRASVYYDALRRHLDDWFEGNDFDDGVGGSRMHQICHILACAAILADALAADVLIDDRQFPGGYRAVVRELTPHVRRLRDEAQASGLAPHHYTISDVKDPAHGA